MTLISRTSFPPLLAAALATVVVALAGPAPVAAQLPISPQEAVEPAPPPVVDGVEIAGNKRVDEAAIRVRLEVEAGSAFDEAKIDADIRSLYAMGFFRNITASLEDRVGQQVLIYRVEERPFVRDVEIAGNDEIDEDELEAMIRVRPNTILDPEKARAGIAEVKKAYEKKGYLDADVSYDTTQVGDSDEVVVTFRIDEREPVRIEEIVLEGNEAIGDRKLKGVLATSERGLLSFLTGAGNLDREVLQTDAERLTAYYYENGYIDVRVDEPQIERKEDGLVVTFKVEEGEAYHFGEVTVVGETLEGLEAADFDLESEQGEVFRPSKLRRDMNLVTELYGDRGYAFVNVTPDTRINAAEKTVDVGFRVVRGPEVFIDRIEVTGNTKTLDKVVRREMELEEQGKFSGTKLRRSQERIQRTGFFQDVNITTRKADREDRLDVLVDVREGNTGTFSAGAGISSASEFLFNVSLSEINLFGRGQRLLLQADIGTIRRNLTLSLTEPYLFDTQVTAGVDIFNWELQFDEFTRGGTGGGIRFLYPFEALGLDALDLGLFAVPLIDTRLGLEYRIEQAEISGVSIDASSVIRAEQGTRLTSAVIPRIFRDTRNHPFDPTRGSLQDLSFETAGLGGDSKFMKLESRARWYVPIWQSESFGDLTYSTGWNFGYGVGYGGERELPLFERYFPGGINTVRGFRVRSMGPRVPVYDQFLEDGTECPLGVKDCGRLIRYDVIGGSHQLIVNNEIIFPLVRSLGLKGVVFFDAGNAFSAAEGIDVNELRLAVGAGIRWLSPIGPLRIEVGFPINEREGDDTQIVQFSFGGAP
jgi:outer membrane protein insertion porin family